MRNALLVLVCLGVGARGARAASTSARKLEDGLSATIVNGKNIYLLAKAGSRDDQRMIAEQVMVEPDYHTRYVRSPGLRVPLYRLNPEYRLAVTETLFPKDKATRRGWDHRVTYADNSRDGGESLWRISEWFTGAGRHWETIATYNGLSGNTSLRVGHRVVIPNSVLLPEYRMDYMLAPLPTPAPTPVVTEGPPAAAPWGSDLTYHEDSQGAYARYRMRRGETLYTDVVVRYTDRVSYAEVMGAAREIAARSGIRDVTRIRSDQAIKIPIELLSVEYRPLTDPTRLEYEQTQQLARTFQPPDRHMNLVGVTVVLDAGHGGEDPGAIGAGNVYEDEVCYDVAMRAKRILEEETAADVAMLVQDRSQEWEVSDATWFSPDKDEIILTHPTYAMTDAKVSVNLRWYLANSIYRRAVANGTDPDDILFTSFHADALHPAVYGAMVYIPGARYSRGSTGRSGRVYTRRAEVREAQYVSIAWRDRVRMEGRSRNFANLFIKELRQQRIPVHTNKPVRDVIYRGRSRFVPGVIRQNLIPNKVLIELVNLKNGQDADQIKDPEFREKLARAYANAVIEFYGGEPDTRLARQAASRRNGLSGE